MTKYEIKIVSVKSQIILQGKSLFLVCVKWISKEQCTEPYNKLLKTTGIKERFEAVHTKWPEQKLGSSVFKWYIKEVDKLWDKCFISELL